MSRNCVAIIGEAGVGKSRLVRHFQKAIAGTGLRPAPELASRRDQLLEARALKVAQEICIRALIGSSLTPVGSHRDSERVNAACWP